MVVSSAGLRPKSDCSGKAQKQLYSKLQARPLVREGATHQETRNRQTENKKKSGHVLQMGARHQDRGRLTVGRKLTSISSTSNIEILERFQSKALRIIVDAPWHVLNNHIRRDLQMPSVKEEIRRYSSQYSTRLTTQPNDQILTLKEIPGNRRL
jgi:uncharacterized protein with von Willebrand factor type A (vWA) domain